MSTTDFWTQVEQAADTIRGATTVNQVITTLNDYFPNYPGTAENAAAFYPGSGGDDQLRDQLIDAGWTITWSQAPYHYVARDHHGKELTYIEGDIYPDDHRSQGRPITHNDYDTDYTDAVLHTLARAILDYFPKGERLKESHIELTHGGTATRWEHAQYEFIITNGEGDNTWTVECGTTPTSRQLVVTIYDCHTGPDYRQAASSDDALHQFEIDDPLDTQAIHAAIGAFVQQHIIGHPR